MKKFVLSEVLLLSTKERKAKKVELDPVRTIILGKNDTGKSSFIKSIYKTFGAVSAKENPKWKKVDPISLVRFSVDEINYSVLKDGKFYALFDSQDKIINVYDSITNGLGPALAGIFDFKIKLSNQSNELITPPPAFLFLPYYVDQDASWQNPWVSFSGLQQIKKYKQPVIEYHTGIRNNDYYSTKGEIDLILNEISNLENERKISRTILNKLKDKLTSVDFSIDLEYFKDEIRELLVECQKLKKEQDVHKGKLVDLFNLKITFESQIEVVKHTLNETRKDYKFANSYEHEGIDCPTCGAHYENSFSERFEIAKDEDRCIELLVELTRDLKDVSEKIEKENLLFNKTNIEIERLEQILEQKKEEVKLRDLIENEGKKELNIAFQENINDLNRSITENAVKEKGLREKLNSIENKDRKKKIKDEYVSLMKKYLRDLDVLSLKEEDYKDFTKSIPNTGSALPRTLVAYYFSVLNIIRKYSSTAYCPIIIDSPNQQAQDVPHIDQILNFIKDNQPADSQMVLGLEELYNVNFDCKVVNFSEKYSLLQKSDYDEVHEDMTPFLNQVWNSGKTGSLFLF